MIPPLLREVSPEFALELELALERLNENKLAEHVQFLRFVRRCGCQDDFCASFYTSPKPDRAWEGDFHDVVLEIGEEGILILDVVNGTICFVEVLDRPDIREALNL